MSDILSKLFAAECKNPTGHCPVKAKNRVLIDHFDEYGNLKGHYVSEENIMVTGGLDRLSQWVATSTDAGSSWVQGLACGTSSTAESSTQSGLLASTGIVTGTALVKSAVGARTAEYRATFASSNPAGAAVINEIGLMGSTNGTANMIARKVLGTGSINKLAGDSFAVSYQVIFTTG